MPLSTNAASDLSGIDREKLEALKSYSDKLIDLGKKRRLVADFGEKSKNEKEALHIIDSNMAKRPDCIRQISLYSKWGKNYRNSP